MDIFKISIAEGESTKFDTLYNKDYKNKMERYVERSGGPYNVLKPHPNKSPLDQLSEAFRPLEKYKNDIAVIIDGSTTRGFTEPSAASLQAQHLGIFLAQCFDVSDACNGFLRASYIGQNIFKTEEDMKDKQILIINNEYPFNTKAKLPSSIEKQKEVASQYVGLTFSCICTCTLLKKSNNYSWKQYFVNDSRYASHINIPMPQIADKFLPKSTEQDVTLNNTQSQQCLPRFHQTDRIRDIVAKYVDTNHDYIKSVIIPHTQSQTVWSQLNEIFISKELLLYFDKVGNLGSASIPYILYKRYKNNIPKNERLIFFGVAAGGGDIFVNYSYDNDTEKNVNKIDKIGESTQKNRIKTILVVTKHYLYNLIIHQKVGKIRTNIIPKKEIIILFIIVGIILLLQWKTINNLKNQEQLNIKNN